MIGASAAEPDHQAFVLLMQVATLLHTVCCVGVEPHQVQPHLDVFLVGAEQLGGNAGGDW